MLSPVCIRNMWGFIPGRVGGRGGGREFTENLRFPHGGQYQGSTCLGQNWQGMERDLEGTAWQETGLARSSQGWQEGFSCYRDKNQWKTVLSKLLLQKEFAGRILNLKLSNMLWMPSSTKMSHRRKQEKTQVFDKLWYQTSSVRLARSYWAISRSCDIWAASKSTKPQHPCDALRCFLFTRSKFLTLAEEEAPLIT